MLNRRVMTWLLDYCGWGRRLEGHFYCGFPFSGWGRWSRKGYHAQGEGKQGGIEFGEPGNRE